jgi:phosphoglucosamine mutase
VRGRLAGNTVVVTVMTNLAFRLAMRERGIAVRETPVGDRHVLAALDAEGLALGGEQSGHLVFRRSATTGDGLLTGLFLADLVLRSGRPLAELAADLFVPLPQVLVNVVVDGPGRLADAAEVWQAVTEVEAALGEHGRVLLRPSGTEPLVRVMVEAHTEEAALEAAQRLATAVELALGAPPGR